jgi:hypothetical protein
MICPNCNHPEAFWVYGRNIALYHCDLCGYEFKVNLRKWDEDERKSGKRVNDGRRYILKKKQI